MCLSFPLPEGTNAVLLLCFLLKCSLQPSKANKRSCHQLRSARTEQEQQCRVSQGGRQSPCPSLGSPRGFAGSDAGLLGLHHCPSLPGAAGYTVGLGVFWVLQMPREHRGAPSSGSVAGPVISSCGFSPAEGRWDMSKGSHGKSKP